MPSPHERITVFHRRHPPELAEESSWSAFVSAARDRSSRSRVSRWRWLSSFFRTSVFGGTEAKRVEAVAFVAESRLELELWNRGEWLSATVETERSSGSKGTSPLERLEEWMSLTLKLVVELILNLFKSDSSELSQANHGRLRSRKLLSERNEPASDLRFEEHMCVC